MKHRRNYELLPESELDEHLLNEPFTRNNYVDKFHTLLYCEEHEHARVLKERFTIIHSYYTLYVMTNKVDKCIAMLSL